MCAMMKSRLSTISIATISIAIANMFAHACTYDCMHE